MAGRTTLIGTRPAKRTPTVPRTPACLASQPPFDSPSSAHAPRRCDTRLADHYRHSPNGGAIERPRAPGAPTARSAPTATGTTSGLGAIDAGCEPLSAASLDLGAPDMRAEGARVASGPSRRLQRRPLIPPAALQRVAGGGHVTARPLASTERRGATVGAKWQHLQGVLRRVVHQVTRLHSGGLRCIEPTQRSLVALMQRARR